MDIVFIRSPASLTSPRCSSLSLQAMTERSRQFGQQRPAPQVLPQQLLRLTLLQDLRSEQRCQLQDLRGWPARQPAQRFARVALRLDAVRAAAGQQRDQSVLTSALWSLRQNSQLRRARTWQAVQARCCCCEGQPSIGQKAPQGLIPRVAQRIPQGRLQDVLALLLAVQEEAIAHR